MKDLVHVLIVQVSPPSVPYQLSPGLWREELGGRRLHYLDIIASL